MLAGVQRAAVVAATAGATAPVGVAPEGSGEDGRGGGEFFQAMLEHAQNQGGVVGSAHRSPRTRVLNERA